MRILITESYRSISKLKSREAPQITWDRVGTFDTSFLKKVFQTLKQTGLEAVDVHLEGDTAVLTYPRGEIRLESQRVIGLVHSWKPWFDLGATDECDETEIQDRGPEIRRASFRVIMGGAA